MKLIRLAQNRNRTAERELTGASGIWRDNFSGALAQGCDVDDAAHKPFSAACVCFRLHEIYLGIYVYNTMLHTYLYVCVCNIYPSSVSLLNLYELLSGRCRLVYFNIN